MSKGGGYSPEGNGLDISLPPKGGSGFMPPKKTPRLPVQMVAVGEGIGVVLYVICSDGTLWAATRATNAWVQMPCIPQD